MIQGFPCSSLLPLRIFWLSKCLPFGARQLQLSCLPKSNPPLSPVHISTMTIILEALPAIEVVQQALIHHLVSLTEPEFKKYHIDDKSMRTP